MNYSAAAGPLLYPEGFLRGYSSLKTDHASPARPECSRTERPSGVDRISSPIPSSFNSLRTLLTNRGFRKRCISPVFNLLRTLAKTIGDGTPRFLRSFLLFQKNKGPTRLFSVLSPLFCKTPGWHLLWTFDPASPCP